MEKEIKDKRKIAVMCIISAIILLLGNVLILLGRVYVIVSKNQNEIVETYESKLDEMDLEFDEDKMVYDVFVNNKHYLVNYKDTVVLPHYHYEIILNVERDGDTHLIFFVGVYNEEK